MDTVAAAIRKTGKDVNLQSLQRIDENIQAIVYTAPFVVLYTLDLNSCTWARRSTEGTLFMVRRNQQPHNRLVVLNRLNTKNVVEDVVEGMEVEFTHPYVFYRSRGNEVIAIWFFQQQQFNATQSNWKRMMASSSSTSTPKTPHSLVRSKNTMTENGSVNTPCSSSRSLREKCSPKALLSPEFFMKSERSLGSETRQSAISATNARISTNKPLSKNEFRSTVSHLSQNDSFLDALYSVYLRRLDCK